MRSGFVSAMDQGALFAYTRVAREAEKITRKAIFDADGFFYSTAFMTRGLPGPRR
jgi:hypothetical protein